MKEFGLIVLGAVVGVLTMGVVGGMDYSEAQRQQSAYCENVRQGFWPDYKKNFEENCKN